MPLRSGWQHFTRSARFNSFFGSIRQECAPPRHIYLSLLAVDPPCQGQGYAARLLRPMLARQDFQRLTAYLETLTEKNVAFYEHFGFRVVRTAALPGAGFPFYAMLREPQG